MAKKPKKVEPQITAMEVSVQRLEMRYIVQAGNAKVLATIHEAHEKDGIVTLLSIQPIKHGGNYAAGYSPFHFQLSDPSLVRDVAGAILAACNLVLKK